MMDEEEQHELNKLRMQKMKALMEAQKRAQESQQQVMGIKEKLEYILKMVLAPDAWSYLENLKNTEPNVYQGIFNELITQEVVESADYLINIISSRGGVPRRISKDVIIFLERKVKGIKSSIRVQRNDEIVDLGSYLSKS